MLGVGWALLHAVLLAETAAAAPAPAGRLANASLSHAAMRSRSDPRQLQRELDELRGRVIASPVLLSPAVEVDRSGLSMLRRFQSSSFQRTAGFWRLHIIAFLDRPAPAESLLLNIDDLSAPGGPATTRSIEVPVQPGSRVVRLNDLVISDELGFSPGHTYQLSFTRNPGPPRPGTVADGVTTDRKQDAIARGVITLW